MSQTLNHTIGEGIWFDKVKYDEAEKKHYERLAQKGNLSSAQDKKVGNVQDEEEKCVNEMSVVEQHQLSINESIWLDKFKYDMAEIKYYERNSKKINNEENQSYFKSSICGMAVEKRIYDEEINSGKTQTERKDKIENLMTNEIPRMYDDCVEGKSRLCPSSDLDKLVTSIVEEPDEKFLNLEKLKELNLIDFEEDSSITNGKRTEKEINSKQEQEIFHTQAQMDQPNKYIGLIANREDVIKSQVSTNNEQNSQPDNIPSSKHVKTADICSPQKIQSEIVCSPKNVKSTEICFSKNVQPGESSSPKNVTPVEIFASENVKSVEICSPKKGKSVEICSPTNVKSVKICSPERVRTEDFSPISLPTKNENQSQSSTESLPDTSKKFGLKASPKGSQEKLKTENSKIYAPKNETQNDNIRQENSKLPRGYHQSPNLTNDSSRDKGNNVTTNLELKKTQHHHSKICAISDENNPSVKPTLPVSNPTVQVIIQNDKQTEVNSDDAQFKPKETRKKKRTKKDRVRDRKGFTTEGTKNGGWNSLAGEVAKARQHIKTSLQCIDDIAVTSNNVSAEMTNRLTSLEKENNDLKKQVTELSQLLKKLEVRVGSLERTVSTGQSSGGGQPKGAPAPSPVKPQPVPPNDEEDDGVDLFGSDSEEEDEEAAKVKEQRLAEYAARKSKKPTLIAKSNIILDVKPWDDETDMKQMEEEVRKISTDGLVWGASKLVPLAYGIHKLQISCVVEDEKVSIDWLTDTIMENEDYVQSVDIAAFNKV